MNKLFSYILFILLGGIVFLGCQEPNSPENKTIDSEISLEKRGINKGKVVVADRASGTLSIINSKTDELLKTVYLPNSGEPMYVVYVRQNKSVYVGDRANNVILIYDADTFQLKFSVDVGNGVFHMWADQLGKQLWVNNDIDNTTSVIDLKSNSVIATVPAPSEIVDMGGKPHDVIVDPKGKFAFVSYLGIAGSNDYVVKFSTKTFLEKGRAAVGKDPHLSLTARNNFLYVPTQGSDAVYVINRKNMKIKKIINVPGSHGAGMATNGKTFYTTNLPGGGSHGLFAISTKSNEVVGKSDTPFPIPHNIALNTSSKKIYVTHSGGSSNKVTVYGVSIRNPNPVFLSEVTVGFNPFGIAFVN